MHRIDVSSAVGVLPTPEAAGTPGYFGRGNPGSGVRPTTLTADWANAVQEEISHVIESSGDTLDKTDRTQLLQALNALYRPGRLLRVSKLSGSGTFTALTATTTIIALLVGGGGAGGTAAATGGSESAASGGGASGAVLLVQAARAYFHGQSYSVGGGGTGGGGGADNGGDTTFGSATAPGGGEGGTGNQVTLPSTTQQGVPGSAPTASGATILVSSRGSPGHSGLVLNPGVGPGGQVSGHGGAGPWGGGGPNTSDSIGNDATGPGAGGGGAASGPSAPGRVGGAGGAGTIIVYEYS